MGHSRNFTPCCLYLCFQPGQSSVVVEYHVGTRQLLRLRGLRGHARLRLGGAQRPAGLHACQLVCMAAGNHPDCAALRSQRALQQLDGFDHHHSRSRGRHLQCNFAAHNRLHDGFQLLQPGGVGKHNITQHCAVYAAVRFDVGAAKCCLHGGSGLPAGSECRVHDRVGIDAQRTARAQHAQHFALARGNVASEPNDILAGRTGRVHGRSPAKMRVPAAKSSWRPGPRPNAVRLWSGSSFGRISRWTVRFGLA